MVFSGFMVAFGFSLPLYLKRIGLEDSPVLDAEGLRLVHSAQVFSIPFENIDIHLGLPISLKPEDLIAKILDRERGGYCFELNGIFLMALKAMGFNVSPQMARVLYGRQDPGPRTHEVLIVTLSGQKWLADTGFGGPGLLEPIPIIPDDISGQYGEHFRLRQDAELGMVLQKKIQGTFLDLYSFDERELTLENDIETGNHYTSTSPASIFRLRRICSLPQPWGRTTLTDLELAIHQNGECKSLTLSPGPEYMTALARHFGIKIDATYEDLTPLSTGLIRPGL
jgi:N-hydroxyarylamine O-acetyltransferase